MVNEVLKGVRKRKMEKNKKEEMELETQNIKTVGNYSENEKEKYTFEKVRNFYNNILDMVHKFRIEQGL